MNWQSIYKFLIIDYGWYWTDLECNILPTNTKGGKGTHYNFLKSPTRDVALYNGYLMVKNTNGNGGICWIYGMKCPLLDCGISMDKKTNLMTFIIAPKMPLGNSVPSIPAIAMDIS